MPVSYADVDTVDAAISPVGDIDYYKFDGVAGDTVMVYGEMRGTTNYLEGRIRLLDQNGSYLYESTSFAGTVQKQRVVYILPTTGIYYARYSYRNNTSGIPPAEIEKYEQEKKEKELRGEIEVKGPELGTYDEGEYRLILNLFTKSAPIALYAYTNDLNYNATRFYGQFIPNGLPTTATIEYGTTTSYGSSVVIATGANSLYEWATTSEKVSGLSANTTYHFRLKVENEKGVAYTEDNTFTTLVSPEGWEFVNSGVTNTLYAADFIDANNGITVGSAIILKTTDGGITWNNIYPSDQGNYTQRGVDMVTSNKVVSVGSNVVFLSNDAGSTWTKTVLGSYAIYGISFADENNGVLCNSYGEIYKTTDGGVTWNKLTLGVTVQNLYTIKYFSNNTILAAGYNNYVVRSTDGGATWTSQQLSGSSYALWSMSFKDNSNGVIVGYGGMLFKTTDGGATWTSINPGHTYYQYGVNYQSNGTVTSVGSSGSIFKSGDDGATWVRQQSGTSNTLYGINLIGNSSALMTVGDWGTMLKSGNYLKVVSPNGGERLKVGIQKNIKWSSGGVDNVKIEYSTDNGTNYSQIIASTPASIGSYTFSCTPKIGVIPALI